ncbi:nuclear transport factor 2 family protein [Herbiconiux ginsengi]|uniref:SnoaL-like domain-containing protein n=1 Tax=Herbiconiux ginsengi TaxID=381665 RepID=A0A1H3TGN4_9MICO|nr:nuclear transport factor 2 family protein [Herbiconiux ginsengi]SDZ48825.1 SnoaL-like domain-containing protein [Herbiconiux ginsengi]
MSDTENDIEQQVRGWAEGIWRPGIEQGKRLLATPVDPDLRIEERLARLEDIKAIEDAFRLYHIFYGGRDLEATLDLFTDDAIQVNGRGTFIGKESLRSSYEYLMTNQKFIIHHGTNVLVTLDPNDRDAALLTARHINFWVGETGTPGIVGGTYLNRMRRVGGRWLIAEQRLTFNYRTVAELVPRVVNSTAPTPDLPLNQRDLLEDWSLFA